MTARLDDQIRKLLEKWKPDPRPVEWFRPDNAPRWPRPQRDRQEKERDE